MCSDVGRDKNTYPLTNLPPTPKIQRLENWILNNGLPAIIPVNINVLYFYLGDITESGDLLLPYFLTFSPIGA
jgi:hypothetical protein